MLILPLTGFIKLGRRRNLPGLHRSIVLIGLAELPGSAVCSGGWPQTLWEAVRGFDCKARSPEGYFRMMAIFAY